MDENSLSHSGHYKPIGPVFHMYRNALNLNQTEVPSTAGYDGLYRTALDFQIEVGQEIVHQSVGKMG